MPALVPTDHTARVVWIGTNAVRAAALASAAVDRLDLSFDGPSGESHGGAFRPSCSRVTAQHPKGTTIRNVRQLSVLSAEDLAATAAEMGLARLDPAWLGATLVIEGIADFSHVPPSSRLQGPDGVTLVIDMENRPCHLPAKVIDADLAGGGRGAAFKAAAAGRRGVTAWVEREGVLWVGDEVRLHIPDQPLWQGLPDRLTARRG
jgi:hypothetical protein